MSWIMRSKKGGWIREKCREQDMGYNFLTDMGWKRWKSGQKMTIIIWEVETWRSHTNQFWEEISLHLTSLDSLSFGMLIGFKGKQKQGRIRFPGFGRSFSVEAFCQSEISGHLILDSKQLSARIIRSLENRNGSLTSIVQKRTVHSPLAFPLGLGNILSLGLLSRFTRLIPSIWQGPRKFLVKGRVDYIRKSTSR